MKKKILTYSALIALTASVAFIPARRAEAFAPLIPLIFEMSWPSVASYAAQAAAGVGISYAIFKLWDGTSSADCPSSSPDCYTQLKVQQSPTVPQDASFTPPPAALELPPLFSPAYFPIYVDPDRPAYYKYASDLSRTAPVQAQEYLDRNNVPAVVVSQSVQTVNTSTSPYIYYFTLQPGTYFNTAYALSLKFTASYKVGSTTYAAGSTLSAYAYQSATNTRGSFPTHQGYFASPTCDKYYDYDPGSLTCKLPAASASYVQSAPDKVCPVSVSASGAYSFSSKDPDCTRLTTNGALTSTASQLTIKTPDPQAPLNFNNATISNNGTANTMVVSSTDTRSGLTDSAKITTRTADASLLSVSQLPTTYTPAGSTTATSINPVIAYPAQGTGAVQCGGAGMPACAVSLKDSAFDDLVSNTAKTNDHLKSIDSKLSASAPAVSVSTFDSFKKGMTAKVMPDLKLSSQCPRPFYDISLDIPILHHLEFSDGGALCDALSPYESVLRTISILGATITCLYIILRA